jgi:hypothetical protein
MPISQTRNVRLVAHGRKIPCTARTLKQPKYAEEHSIWPFLAMQPRLAIAGAKLRRTNVRERWREPAHAGENTAGEI